MTKGQKISTIASISISVLVVFFYFFSLADLSLNIPIGDDFPAFVDHTEAAVNGSLDAGAFFSQINEHRILYDRIFWISGLWIFHSVNFQTLLFIGNLSLLILLLFFIQVSKRHELPVWLWPTFALLIFSWVGYSNSLCAMMALQNFTFPALVCMGLWMMSGSANPRAIYTGLFILILAFYTTGIGFLAILFGLASLAIRQLNKALVYSALVSILFVALYFAFYEPSPVQSSLFSGLSQPLELLKRYFAFLGGVLPISAFSPLPEAALGLVLSGMLLFALLRLKNQTPHALLVITTFFLLLGAIVVAARFDLNEYIANRFKINSVIIFICVVLLFLKALPQNAFRTLTIAGIFAFATALNLFNYKSYNDYRFWVDEFATDLLNVKYGLETTAFQPKGQNYIRTSFYNQAFQSVYSGLKEELVLKSAVPIQLSETSGSDYQVDGWGKANFPALSRPAVRVAGSDGQTLAYLPVNHSNGLCKDHSGVLRSTAGTAFFLVDLNP